MADENGEHEEEAEEAEVEVPELDVLMETEETFPPPDEFAADANISDPGVYEKAASDREAWWASWAEKLEWIEPWDEVLDWSDPPHAKWFEGGKLNVSANCLDRHVAAGNGDRVAFYWEAEDADDDGGGEGRKEITYEWLLDQVQRFANVLKDLGIGKGDVVGIYMPMVPEAVAAMLGCARIGAIHNVVFGGFSPESVRERMEFSEAKALVTADATLRRGDPLPMKEKVDDIAEKLDSLEHIIVLDRCGTDPPMTEGRDVFWQEAVENADPECEPEPMDAEDPLFILYTSGSTGKPKGILHTTGGYLTHVSATHKMVFDLKDDSDVYWCGADIGWVTGHSYIVYGPLANGATSVMYEGAPELSGRGPLVVDHRALRRLDLLHGADGDPRLHEVGHRASGEARPLVAPPPRLGRRADQPARVALVPRAHRRRELPDRRHLVADRDGRDHDRAAPRPDRDEARLGDAAPPRHRGRDLRQGRQRDRGGRRHARHHGAVARHGAHALQARTTGSSRRTGTATARTPTSSATPRAATRTGSSGSSGGSTTSSTSRATASRPWRSSPRWSRTSASPRQP